MTTTLKDFLELIEYKITDVSDFCWSCFGDNVSIMDYWNGDHNGYNISITFDRKTQEVYLLEACDYKNDRAYRYFTSNAHKDAHADECRRHHADNTAWDDVEYVDLEQAEDFFEKAHAIIQGIDYDTRVSVPLDLPQSQMFELMRIAHEKDITLNQLVEQVLRDEIDRVKVTQNE